MTPEQCTELIDRGILHAFATGTLWQRVETEEGWTWERVEYLEGGLPPQGELRIGNRPLDGNKILETARG